MRKILVLTMILLMSLTSCTTIEMQKDSPSLIKKSLSDVLYSPEKETLLRERVSDFWTAFIKEDYEKIYYIYDPFFQSRTPNKYAFMGSLGFIKYHKYQIKDVKIEGNIAKVKLDIVYSLPNIRLKTQVFSQPETESEIEETWLYVYDNWYKEFYSHAVEAGVAEY